MTRLVAKQLFDKHDFDKHFVKRVMARAFAEAKMVSLFTGVQRV